MPSFPTDSLYKFLTVGGVFLVMLGFYAYERGDEKYLQALTELERARTSYDVSTEDYVWMVGLRV